MPAAAQELCLHEKANSRIHIGLQTGLDPMNFCRHDMRLGNLHWLLMALLLTQVPTGLRAAVFDFTPVVGDGVVSAQHFSATARVELRIGAGNQYLKVVSTPGTVPQDPIINNGVVAWASESTVYYYVFDPATTNWVGGTTAVPGFQYDLQVVDGIVSWSLAGSGYFRVFRSIAEILDECHAIRLGVWFPTYKSGGVVAGVRPVGFDSVVFTWTYDPLRPTPWVQQETSVSGSVTVQSDNGIVAWSVQQAGQQFTVYYSVYDPKPAIRNWRRESMLSEYFANLTVANSVVSWIPISGGGQVNRGYDGPLSQWGSSSKPAAYFAMSTNSGNAPFNVTFIDMSLGANTWLWNFGDGQSSTRRSPIYSYTSFLRTNVGLTVTPSPASSTSQSILTDTILPTGTLKINGATSGGFTTNRNVALTLTVSDNSPNGLALRVSNEGTNWSDWLSFNGTTNATVNWRCRRTWARAPCPHSFVTVR